MKPVRRIMLAVVLLLPAYTWAESPPVPAEAKPVQKTSAKKPIPGLPNFTSYDTDGAMVSLSEFNGDSNPYLPESMRQPVVLIFFNKDCKPCIKEIPIIKKLRSEFESQSIRFLYINVGDEYDDVIAFQERWELDFQTLLDPDFQIFQDYQKTYGFGNALPLTVVADKMGKVKYLVQGEVSEERLAKIRTKLGTL